MSNHFTDCVWDKNGARAIQRAKLLAFRAAEPMFIVRDDRIGTYGIGKGSAQPDWCNSQDGFSFVQVIKPVVH